MHIDPTTQSERANYRLLTGAIVPRPIAWVTSGILPGKINLAPFSAFTFVSSDPPIIGFKCNRRNGERKDTSRNINAYGEYVVHIADESLLEPMHLSAEFHPPDVSEVELLCLEVTPSQVVRTPRIARAPVAMECRLRAVIDFSGRNHAEFIVGEVVGIYVRDDLYRDGKIDSRHLRPICRLGGPNYAALGEITTMAPVNV